MRSGSVQSLDQALRISPKLLRISTETVSGKPRTSFPQQPLSSAESDVAATFKSFRVNFIIDEFQDFELGDGLGSGGGV